MNENEISNDVVDSAIQVHRALGPLNVVAQKPLPLIYEEVHLECGYRVDLMVETN